MSLSFFVALRASRSHRTVKLVLSLLYCALFYLAEARAQSGVSAQITLSGRIRDAESGENLPYATVILRESGQGAAANAYGFYSLSLSPGDSVTLVATYVGYVPQRVRLKPTLDLNLDLSLQPASATLEEVEVTATRSEAIQDNVGMSTTEVPVAQIQNMPALLGEADVLKAVQLLPGVQSGSEGTNGLYVRGGGPDQNLILLDGVPLYYVSHLGGFFSVFNPDAIQNVQLIKGGYPAQYGGRLSSILDVRMKEGNQYEWSGKAQVGLISAKASVEGPLIEDRTSLVLSARRTYIDLFTRPISRLASEGDASFGYNFYDLNAKINHKLDDRNHLYLSFFGGDDRASVNYEFEDEDGRSYLFWGTYMTAARWNHTFNPKLFLNTTAYWSRYRFTIGSEFDDDETEAAINYNSGIRDVGLTADVDYFANNQHRLRFGGQMLAHRFKPGVNVFSIEDRDPDTRDIDTSFGSQDIDGTEAAIYIEDEWTLSDRMRLRSGLHFSTFFAQNDVYPNLQPRLSARYKLTDLLSWKASYASMQQNIHLLSNTDAGIPTDLWVPSTDRVAPQRSWQVATGFARPVINEEFELSLEGYYREMSQLIAYREGASFLGSSEDWQELIETGGEGRAYGLEVLFQKKTGRLSGWIGYTLAWSERRFDNVSQGDWYPFRFDRRHDVGATLSYAVSDQFSAAANWVYGTGNAFSLPEGRYPGVQPELNGLPNYFSDDVFIYSERNNFRMEAYHRLDVGIQTTKKTEWGERTWRLGLYNAYNRNNPFFYELRLNNANFYDLRQYSLFPIVPYLSYQASF
mgnify:CR=1 FL=1